MTSKQQQHNLVARDAVVAAVRAKAIKVTLLIRNKHFNGTIINTLPIVVR